MADFDYIYVNLVKSVRDPEQFRARYQGWIPEKPKKK